MHPSHAASGSVPSVPVSTQFEGEMGLARDWLEARRDCDWSRSHDWSAEEGVCLGVWSRHIVTRPVLPRDFRRQGVTNP